MNYCPSSVAHRHRHQSDHECEKLEIPKPRMAATQKLVKDIIGKYLESVFVVYLLLCTREFQSPASVSLPVMEGAVSSPDGYNLL